MNNLAVSILVIFSVVVVVLSTWGLMYLALRIYLRLWIKRECGDMPSEKDIRELYERINSITEYKFWNGLDHSPTDANEREEGQSTLE